MAKFIRFNGVTTFRPGALSQINANALTPIGLSARGIVHLLGEADGGAPGSDGVVMVDDPALAKELFRSGPLADAIRVAFNASGDSRIPGNAFRVVAYKVNSGTQSSTTVPGDEAVVSDTSTGASTTTVITTTGGGLVADEHIGRWLLWNNQKRRIVDNTTTTITVSPGFSSAPQNLDAVSILNNQLELTSRDYGAHTNQITVEFEEGNDTGVIVTLTFEGLTETSGEIAGEAKVRVKYVGGPIEDSGVATVTNATTVSLDVASAPLLNAWAGMVMRFEDGSQRLISGNTAADPSVVTLDAAHALTTAQQTDLDNTTAQIIDVTTADASFTGANGEATGFSSAVTSTADDLSLDFSTLGLTTLRDFVEYLNGYTNYEASVPDGVNQDTTLLADFDFGTRNTDVDVRFDEAIDPDNKGSFRQDLVTVINWINEFSNLATATRSSVGTDEGAELPAITTAAFTAFNEALTFTGGSRGTSTNSNWQDGFDALIQVRGNNIVPLISYDLVNDGFGSTATFASVGAQLKAHVALCRGIGKNEMGGYMGMEGTKDEIMTQLVAFNDTDVQLCAQTTEWLDVDGNLTVMPEWATAVAAAGMRSGTNEVGDSLTFKLLNTTGLDQDTSWSPTDRTDVNQLLEDGLLFAEVTPAGAVRWVRDITTYTQDENLAFYDGATREAVRFLVYDLRTFLEDTFTGLKAKPATLASIREMTGAKMAEYLRNGVIVESLDPETQTTLIAGFRKLRVTIEGDVATVRVEIFPATSIAFTLISVYLQLPRLSG